MGNYDLDNPVDAVIAWVDGQDEKHKEKILHYRPGTRKLSKDFFSRYAQTNEIQYCIHSILKYADFIRNIFIVTDNQIPKFLIDEKSDRYKKVKVVDHTEIYRDNKSSLPVFNSRSIETKIHHIPGLAEHFIYFNDDMILLRKVSKSDFFIDDLPVIRGSGDRLRRIFFTRDFVLRKKPT